jgi:phosphoglycerate dehydrogenase-like enzyme
MAGHTLLVLNHPAARHLTLLARLPEETRIVVSDRAEGFVQAAPEADILLVGAAPRALVEEVWAMAPRLKWVHSMWAGLETLLFPALVESDVILTNGRGVFARSLSEFALTGMLWFAKDVRRMRRQQREAHWEKFTVTELHGRTLGIIGHGSIGRATAALASAFGMHVRGVGRKHTPEEFAAILENSDYVLAAAPLTPATRGLIGEAELRRMKPGAVLINLGRGPVVVEDALIRALREGWIRGAVLDVYDEEPLPAGHAFWSLDNVLLSPHCADNTDTWLNEAMELFLENYDRFSRGEALKNVTDKRLGY